jgi:hypothetical protein
VRLLLEAAPETFWQRDHKGQLPIQVAACRSSRRGLVRMMKIKNHICFTGFRSIVHSHPTS